MLRLEAGPQQHFGSASASAGKGNELVLVERLIQSNSPGIRLKSGVSGGWEENEASAPSSPILVRCRLTPASQTSCGHTSTNSFTGGVCWRRHPSCEERGSCQVSKHAPWSEQRYLIALLTGNQLKAKPTDSKPKICQP